MKQLKFIVLMFFSVLVPSVASAQDDTVATEEVETVTETYWEDTANNEGKILNSYKFFDNWYVGVQGGLNFNWGRFENEMKFGDRLRYSFAAQLGKWFTPSLGARVQLGYNNNTSCVNKDGSGKYNWHSLFGFADATFNFTNMFWGFKEKRVFNLIGFFGLGGEWVIGHSDHRGTDGWNEWERYDDRIIADHDKTNGYNDEKHIDLAGHIGLIGNFRVSRYFDLSVELSNTWINDSYNGVKVHDRWDSHLNLLAGVTYRFKNHDGTHEFTYARRDMSKYDPFNDEINRLKAETDAAIEWANTPEYVKSNQATVYVSFENGKANIDKLQEVNVFTAAKQLESIGLDNDLYITSNGGEPAKNMNLFVKRANSIRDVLVKTHKIPAGRIFIEQNPQLVKSIKPEQECVVVLINE